MLFYGIQFPTDRSDDPLLIKCVCVCVYFAFVGVCVCLVSLLLFAYLAWCRIWAPHKHLASQHGMSSKGLKVWLFNPFEDMPSCEAKCLRQAHMRHHARHANNLRDTKQTHTLTSANTHTHTHAVHMSQEHLGWLTYVDVGS